ncbi:PTS sugar transporter subunit IIA [Enterococcus sp. ALS3]|uniref:PTS sugar transporter subunit IIA n=1 Tax=Enterococcus alishanensis TaxID=1303817 RepID=A0ABS6TC15_9ENTE|nr:PTS sugar transporter subunit IIA [Enterococcus alishanensis]MBV7390431.1 PTS sugar transporter subunit IIA [Enterococcus alishanensis]
MGGIKARQKYLIQLLVQNEDYLPVAYFAEKIAKTNRTIYSDLEAIQNEINLEAYNITLERKPRRGIRLLGNAEDKMKLLQQMDLDLVECPGQSPAQRQFLIAKMLLIDEATVTHKGLSEEFHVSPSSIMQDLEKIHQQYHVNVLSSNKGTCVVCSEEDLQRSIFRFCENYLKEHHISDDGLFEQKGYQALTALFGDQIVTAIIEQITNIERHSEFDLSYQYKKSILLSFIIYFFRLKKGQLLSPQKEFLFEQIQSIDTYYLATELVADLAKRLNFDNSEEIVAYINRQLIGYGVKMKMSDQKDYQKFEPIIDQIFQQMGEMMQVDFSQDRELKERFIKHFIPMIYRLKLGLETTNPLLAEIKNQYSVIFRATWYAMAVVEKQLAVSFNEEEVAFLAMYFQVSLEKSRNGKKILIVCPTGVGTSELILNRIARVLPAQDIAEVTTLQSLYSSQLASVDLIISSVELTDIQVPVIKVSPLITEEDIKNISSLYADFFFRNEETEQLITTDFPHLREILDLSLIETRCRFKDKQQCLDYMIEKLEKRKIVTKDFRREVFEREKLGETALSTGVAIPHAAPQNVQVTKIFLLALEEPILWSNKKVKFVLLICIADQERRLLKGAMTDIHKLVKTDQTVNYFFHNKSAEEIYQLIKGVS